MITPKNRMATTLDRAATEPVQRVPVQPPPELVIQCQACKASRLALWRTVCGHRNGDINKQCKACGAVYRFSADFKVQRRIR